MAGSVPPPRIPLPRGWPRLVKSAVIHAISLAQFSLTHTRSWAANNWNARIRLKAENDRLRQEIALLVEEMRIKDSRMLRIPAQRRPHYPPTERLAILELRAARGWSRSQAARRLLVTPATVCSWVARLEEEGPRAIVRLRVPVNKFPDFVAYIVRRLKVLCPSMGKAKIAQVLCRAGLHLGSTSVQRMLQPKPCPRPTPVSSSFPRVATANRPNHIWHSDLSTVPTSLGFWTSWFPFSLPQRWPFCWWIAVAVDQFSRADERHAQIRKARYKSVNHFDQDINPFILTEITDINQIVSKGICCGEKMLKSKTLGGMNNFCAGMPCAINKRRVFSPRTPMKSA